MKFFFRINGKKFIATHEDEYFSHGEINDSCSIDACELEGISHIELIELVDEDGEVYASRKLFYRVATGGIRAYHFRWEFKVE